MRIPESELILNPDGSVFHLHLRPEELAGRVVLVGDPGRVEMVSSFFDRIEFSRGSREFVSCTGWYRGKRITVLSTGIGAGNIDIAMTELDALVNVDFSSREVRDRHRSLDILRIGTSGAIQPDIPLGAFVFSEISIGFDGLLNWYEGKEKIVLPDFEDAYKRHSGWVSGQPVPYFVRAGKGMAARFAPETLAGSPYESDVFFGMTVSAAGFYGPQGRCIRLQPRMSRAVSEWEHFRHEGHRITNIEMESASLAGLAALLGHNAGTICCIIAHRYNKNANPDYRARVRELVAFALDRL